MYWFARRYYARLIHRFAPAGSEGASRRLIEIGCGLGGLLRLVQDDFEVTGIDPLEMAVEASRQNAPRANVIRADAGWIGTVDDHSIDVVVMMHVVEHLARPRVILEQICRVLRPNGLALVATPNPEYSLRSRKDVATDAIGQDPTHINVHPPSTWRRWCGDAGFTTTRHFGDGLWDVPYVPLVPAPLQLVVFGAPAFGQVLFTGTRMPLSMGVNQILILHSGS